MATMASLISARRRAAPTILRAVKSRSPSATIARTTTSPAALSTVAASVQQEICSSKDSYTGSWGRAGKKGTVHGWGAVAAAFAATVGLVTFAGTPGDGVKNCGIVGVVSSTEKGGAVEDAVDFLFEVRGVTVRGFARGSREGGGATCVDTRKAQSNDVCGC